ncbi:Hsp20/alpha crystallin family protein [Hymenobacter sp. BT442]|uniref:Hsp20/alpha crystallin family protein n=2 Tax=Hymenobacter negativus TaxID=2795026 RepID=A0ABS0Q2T6_9BACT|nr:Hsp20/alpha crystallin family protein [Hymenobacter negativus]
MPARFSTLLDRFFDDNMNMPMRGQMNRFFPKVDTYETDSSYDIDAALPGMKEEDINVSLDQGRLTIAGERKFENERNDRRYHVIESSYGSFLRTFQLPDTADAAKIDASFQNGVLHVHVPKGAPKTTQQRIPVHNGQGKNADQAQNAKK